MVKEGKVRSLQGTDVSLKADTVCIHGDGAHALHFAKKIRRELRAADIKVQASFIMYFLLFPMSNFYALRAEK